MDGKDRGMEKEVTYNEGGRQVGREERESRGESVGNGGNVLWEYMNDVIAKYLVERWEYPRV